MGSAMPRKGYTLVEVLMALFLLAFGLLAMLVLITAGIFQTMRQGQDLSVEYTSENAHSLVRLVLNSQPPPAHRFVSVVLSARRLPQSGEYFR
jgi:prepilin-type N-terminal cleavage/methylation domain-containing protein